MDSNYPPINKYNVESQDWTAFYSYVQESMAINAPAPQGKAVVIRMMVDNDHAGIWLTAVPKRAT